MSLLVSWVAVDNHGATSVYIAGDSRITFSNKNIFNFAKKVFASQVYPEILGYVGEVMFPSIVLSQIVEMIDSNLLFTNNLSCTEKNKLITQILASSYKKYPNEWMSDFIQFIHITRETKFSGYPRFNCFIFEKAKNNRWDTKQIDLPEQSGLLYVLGSGRNEFYENYQKFQKSDNRDTSRNIFHCFCYTLFKIKDKNCGGAPQLVGIYRKPESAAINFGIIHNKKRYFLGSDVLKKIQIDKIEWRNINFELCDGKTLKKFPTAKKQPISLQ